MEIGPIVDMEFRVLRQLPTHVVNAKDRRELRQASRSRPFASIIYAELFFDYQIDWREGLQYISVLLGHMSTSAPDIAAGLALQAAKLLQELSTLEPELVENKFPETLYFDSLLFGG